jgi:hypothetical protein
MAGAGPPAHSRPCPTEKKNFGKSEVPSHKAVREIQNTKATDFTISFANPRLLTPTLPRPADHTIRDGSLLRKESGHPRMFNQRFANIDDVGHETDDVKL